MRAPVGVVALVALAASACTFDEKAITVQKAQIVVHAVLDPNASTQEVLVEKTLTGAVAVREGVRYDPEDPINSGEGVPVAGALVQIDGPDGRLIGKEAVFTGKPAGYGAGRYLVGAGFGTTGFPLTPIRPGARYTLTVRTTDGTVVTGTTIVPNSPIRAVSQVVTSFDRDRDTLRLEWNTVPFARTYGVRVESPFGGFMLFSDSTKLRFDGSLRNFFASDLQHVFIPGFTQAVTLIAVDTNFFDYYRSRNDPFTGSGIINRLKGGIGLFGSVVMLETRNLGVTQQPKDPVLEGEYELVQAPVSSQGRLVDVLRLYVETLGPPTSLSGWYARDRVSPVRDGIAGARDGARIELDFLLEQDSRRRLVTFVGAQVADSLVGAYIGSSGRVVFKKRK